MAIFEKQIQRLNSRLPLVGFVLLFLLGALIYKDFGISTDEEQQRLIGKTSLSFLVRLINSPSLINENKPLAHAGEVFNNFNDRDYGVGFELPLEIFIKIFDLEDTQAYFFRHALTFLMFLFGVCAVYGIAKERYLNWRWGFLAGLILVFSPRIFGDAFFNNKDLVFMSIFTIGAYTLIKFSVHPNFKYALYHGIACGLAIDIRIMAIILPAATIFIFVLKLIKNEINLKQFASLIFFYIITAICIVLIFWPWLWLDPLNNFFLAFKSMSKFRWNGYMYFMGDLINPGVYVPWYYIPVWLGVTTPPMYLVLFIFGALLTVGGFLKSGVRIWNSSDQMQDLIVLTLFLGPLLAVILLHSVLYNGWRHLYFIYPAFVLMVIRGLYEVWNWRVFNKVFRKIISILLITSLTYTGFWMFQHHPFQFLYFNSFAGDWSKNFDVDYWGVAYRRPLEKIIKSTPQGPLVVFNKMGGASWGYWQIPYWQNIPLFKPSDSARFDGTKSEVCSDFVITSTAGNATQYSQKEEFDLIDELKIDNKLIYATYKRKVPLSESAPKMGKALLFSNNATQCYLKSGWIGRAEDWGVWSIANNAQLTLPLPEDADKKKPVFLNLILRAFVNEKHPVQKVFIAINDGQPKEYVLRRFKDNHLRLLLSDKDLSDPELRLNIFLPNAVSPKELGIGVDERLLGVGLVQAEFN